MQDEIVRSVGAQNEFAENRGTVAQGMGPMPEPPTPSPRPLPRQIQINSLNHGYHVIVGCQAFAVETVDGLLHRLGVYLKNPEQAEKNWMSGEWKM
jgi:hypothetical protein